MGSRTPARRMGGGAGRVIRKAVSVLGRIPRVKAHDAVDGGLFPIERLDTSNDGTHSHVGPGAIRRQVTGPESAPERSAQGTLATSSRGTSWDPLPCDVAGAP